MFELLLAALAGLGAGFFPAFAWWFDRCLERQQKRQELYRIFWEKEHHLRSMNMAQMLKKAGGPSEIIEAIKEFHLAETNILLVAPNEIAVETHKFSAATQRIVILSLESCGTVTTSEPEYPSDHASLIAAMRSDLGWRAALAPSAKLEKPLFASSTEVSYTNPTVS